MDIHVHRILCSVFGGSGVYISAHWHWRKRFVTMGFVVVVVVVCVYALFYHRLGAGELACDIGLVASSENGFAGSVFHAK